MERDYLDVTRLIRCIQRAEGNPDCFRGIRRECREYGCCWRQYCFEESPGLVLAPESQDFSGMTVE